MRHRVAGKGQGRGRGAGQAEDRENLSGGWGGGGQVLHWAPLILPLLPSPPSPAPVFQNSTYL